MHIKKSFAISFQWDSFPKKSLFGVVASITFSILQKGMGSFAFYRPLISFSRPSTWHWQYVVAQRVNLLVFSSRLTRLDEIMGWSKNCIYSANMWPDAGRERWWWHVSSISKMENCFFKVMFSLMIYNFNKKVESLLKIINYNQELYEGKLNKAFLHFLHKFFPY